MLRSAAAAAVCSFFPSGTFSVLLQWKESVLFFQEDRDTVSTLPHFKQLDNERRPPLANKAGAQGRSIKLGISSHAMDDGKGRKQARSNGYPCRRKGWMSQGNIGGLVGRESLSHGCQERGSPREKHSEENVFRDFL